MKKYDRRRSSDAHSLGSLKMHVPSYFQKQFRTLSIEELYTTYWIRHRRLLLCKLTIILIVYYVCNLILYITVTATVSVILVPFLPLYTACTG